MTSIENQLQTIQRGTIDILPEEELKEKLKVAAAKSCPLRVKLGVDPTAPDIHLGHTVVLRKLRQFQELGHHAVLIIGDYTALVGDPSGRSKTRPQLSVDEITRNAQTYLDQVKNILLTDRLEIVHNGDWFRSLSFDQVLKMASQMTVSQMLERDDFHNRFKAQSPIGIHEFLYPLMQGYDSVQVRSDIELGGTDQTFNLLVGRELQKAEGMTPQVCITLPLLIGLDGVNKMSKSLDNYVGVTDSSKNMFGKLMSLSDAQMKDYFELLTDFPQEESNALLNGESHPREVKEKLAKEITSQYFDTKTAEKEAEEFRRIFSQKKLPSDIPDLVITDQELVDKKIWIVKLIVNANFASSNSDARRLVAQGGVSLEGETIKDVNAQVLPNNGAILKVGKRRYARVVLE